jgi:hypothetical protein
MPSRCSKHSQRNWSDEEFDRWLDPLPTWRGLRPLRISRKVCEGGNVISLMLEPTDGRTRSDAPADGNVLICCSPPEGDVVIDL